MNPFLLLKGLFRQSWGGVAALALLLALSLSLGICVSMTERGLRQGASRAGNDFDLLIGAQGSAVQLMLSAVYLQNQVVLPLVPASLLGKVAAQPGVKWAAGMALGDRWQSSPLVGVSPELLTLGQSRSLREGRLFAHLNEAVVGAGVPLALGEKFSPQHGQMEMPAGSAPEGDHAHSAEYTVVGRLPATGTPWDNALLVPVESLWQLHGNAQRGFSALVVKPVGLGDAYRLRGQWQNVSLPAEPSQGLGAVMTQSAFTGEVLTNLFVTLGDVQSLLQAMAVAAQAVALCGALLVGLLSVALRKPLLTLLRALGAPRTFLLGSVWLLVFTCMALGVLAGLGLGWGMTQGVALWLKHSTRVFFDFGLSWVEIQLCLVALGAGSVCALVPALLVYRKSSS